MNPSKGNTQFRFVEYIYLRKAHDFNCKHETITKFAEKSKTDKTPLVGRFCRSRLFNKFFEEIDYNIRHVTEDV